MHVSWVAISAPSFLPKMMGVRPQRSRAAKKRPFSVRIMSEQLPSIFSCA